MVLAEASSLSIVEVSSAASSAAMSLKKDSIRLRADRSSSSSVGYVGNLQMQIAQLVDIQVQIMGAPMVVFMCS